MKIKIIFLELCILFPAAVVDAAPGVVVLSPVANGNSDSIGPFQIQQGALTSMRYQEVHAFSEGSAALPGGGIITQMRYRLDTSSINYLRTIASIQINLSITPRAPDQLSATFADNVGVNETVVFGPGPLTLSSIGSGSPDITVPFSQGFYYNPAAGNLLIDVRNFVAAPFDSLNIHAYDAQSTVGDSVSRV